MGEGGMQFRSAATIVAGLIVASGVAAALAAMMFGDIKVFTPAVVIVMIVAAFLGLPAYFAARAAQNDTLMVAAAMGFIVGAAIPAILILAGPAADQASTGDTATVIDGSYTLAGWLENLTMIGLFGLLGVGGGLVFYFIVRRSGAHEDQPEVSVPPSPLRTGLLTVAAAGVIAATVAIPYATADRTCHNTLRDGRKSIGQAASFDLRVGIEEWRNVKKEMDAFRRSGDWSVRSDVRTDKSFPWLQISLCQEPGTNIFVQGIESFNVVNFGVYQPQGGETWRRDFRALYERISARWPNKVVFNDGQGQQTGRPEWATAEKPSRKR